MIDPAFGCGLLWGIKYLLGNEIIKKIKVCTVCRSLDINTVIPAYRHQYEGDYCINITKCNVM